ncbi:alpha-L-glutamate ligase-like protein [Thalassolituus sp. LLYu03]|uniref:alpha-L-glutamate ligase-like protein n=1 Tax=Thalassolituus sp. LLYu03 TaxID=3421656 RepID=UPI003D276557
MFIWPWKLNELGILGMNRRNISYISRYNPRHLYPLVDNKLKTKLLAQQAGITTPGLIGTITSQHDVAALTPILEGVNGFAIKPAKGSGGKGILVLTRNAEGAFVKSSGTLLTMDDLERHVSNILAGLYSLGGSPDIAIIEELIEFDPRLDGYSFEGVPDIRVIVCRGYPVMAMMRLSTRSSDGKANLHQGAVGVGLDIGTGRPLKAVQNGDRVERHPDTGSELAGLLIPDWQQLLELAARCYEVTGLGYLGTDMVLDHRYGPMLLELNARPGLTIQVANGAGLLPRLRKIDALSEADVARPAEERVALSREWFACKPLLQPGA